MGCIVHAVTQSWTRLSDRASTHACGHFGSALLEEGPGANLPDSMELVLGCRQLALCPVPCEQGLSCRGPGRPSSLLKASLLVVAS